jgi:hypothetical protein
MRTIILYLPLLLAALLIDGCQQPAEPSLPNTVAINLRGTSWVLTRINTADGKRITLPTVSTPTEQGRNRPQPLYTLEFSTQSDSINVVDNCTDKLLLYSTLSDVITFRSAGVYATIGCRDYSYDEYITRVRSTPSCKYAVDSTYLVLSYTTGQLIYRRVDKLF